MPLLEPDPRPLEPPILNHLRERSGGQRRVGILVHVGEAHAGLDGLPRPLPAGPAIGLLDEPVLGELTQVERAVRRALAHALGSLGGGQRPTRVVDALRDLNGLWLAGASALV